MDTKRLIEVFRSCADITISQSDSGEKDGYLIKTFSNPEAGYHWGYLMYLPNKLRETPTLLVEGPSVGEVGDISKSCEIIYDKARFELSWNGYPHDLAKQAQCPIIMPLFPRPEDKENNTNIFTHALSSRAMFIKNPPLARVDLQLIAMFKDIKKKFLSVGLHMADQLIIMGFSSGGDFAHRFTILHPEYVLAAIGGGHMHTFTLPLETYQDELLLWPNGIGNATEFCTSDFETYKKVKQFFYMGDQDSNDSVPYGDSYTEEERQQVYRLFGTVGVPDRWNLYQELCQQLHLDQIICKTDVGMDHRPSNEIRDMIVQYVSELLQ